MLVSLLGPQTCLRLTDSFLKCIHKASSDVFCDAASKHIKLLSPLNPFLHFIISGSNKSNLDFEEKFPVCQKNDDAPGSKQWAEEKV